MASDRWVGTGHASGHAGAREEMGAGIDFLTIVWRVTASTKVCVCVRVGCKLPTRVARRAKTFAPLATVQNV